MTTLVHLVNGAESIPYAVAVDSSYVYWTDLGTNQILRCALPSCGGNPEVFANDLDAPTGITIFKGTVYWTNGDETAGSVLSCPTSGCGSGPTTIASSQENPYAIAVDDSGIYWTNLVGGTVMHCPRVGCTRPSTLAHAPGAFAIALDAESVYFTTALADGQVLRVAK
jgi:hypothetical protein